MARLDVLPILFPQIEFIGLYLPGQHAETLFVEFHLGDEVGRLVVCVPAEMIHISVAVDDAGTNLCPKLDLGLCLAPDDGTEVRLVDTDDAVGTSADVLLEHHFLLFVHFECCLKTFVVMAAEAIARSS